VRGDVPAAAVTRVASKCMQSFHRQAAQARESGFHAIEQVAIAHQQAHQSDQVIAMPEPIHVRLARADRAVAGRGAIEAGIADMQRDVERIRRVGAPDADVAERINHAQLAAAQVRQTRQQLFAQESIEASVAGVAAGVSDQGVGRAAHR